MPKLGYGYAHYSGSPSSLPSDISGLRLWLKADAGVKFGGYVKEITLTGSAGGLGDGVFTREDAGTNGLAPFSSSNASIYWDAENLRWYSTGDGSGQLYSNFSPVFAGDWNLEDGGSPFPTASYKFFPPSQNNITTWEDQSGNKNNFTGYNGKLIQSAINGKLAVLADPYAKTYLKSPTTLFNGLSSFSFIAVCYNYTYTTGGQWFSDGAGGSYFSIYDADPGIFVNINGALAINGYAATTTFFGPWSINYLDATTANGSAFQNGKTSQTSFISQITLTGSGDSTSNGVYTRASGGNTQFDGSSGNYIFWDGGWYLYDASLEINTYWNPNYDFDGDWQVESGNSPAPSQSLVTSYATALNPSGIILPLPNGYGLSLGDNYIQLAELLIYNKRLSTIERKQIEGYLNAKYAIY
jgi:hypothetical protein